jgi:hypothetical protein
MLCSRAHRPLILKSCNVDCIYLDQVELLLRMEINIFGSVIRSHSARFFDVGQ